MSKQKQYSFAFDDCWNVSSVCKQPNNLAIWFGDERRPLEEMLPVQWPFLPFSASYRHLERQKKKATGIQVFTTDAFPTSTDP